jgi:hypothetical protein
MRTALLTIVLAGSVLSEFRPLGTSDARQAALQTIADTPPRWAANAREFLPSEVTQVQGLAPGPKNKVSHHGPPGSTDAGAGRHGATNLCRVEMMPTSRAASGLSGASARSVG